MPNGNCTENGGCKKHFYEVWGAERPKGQSLEKREALRYRTV